MKDFEHEVKIGVHHIYETCSNLVNMAVRLDQEKDKTYNGADQYIYALSKSIVFFEFNILEILANFLAHISINLSTGNYSNAPVVVVNLDNSDILFLSEKKINNLCAYQDSFQSLREKLKKNPHLLAKLFQKDYSLDTCNTSWQKFLSLESARNAITHPKFDDQKSYIKSFDDPFMNFEAILPLNPITPKVIFDSIYAVRWYIREINLLFKLIDIPKFKALILASRLIDSFCFMTMVSLSVYCSMNESDIKKSFPEI